MTAGTLFQARRLVGEAAPIRALRDTVVRLADLNTTVLILGETGTGKGVIARALHERSARPGPFVHVDCASLSPNLLESELFGHERGAFTGAAARRTGRLEQAAGGTLFLDEIGELAPDLQAKWLRVLQDRCFERVGGERTLPLEARVVAATHRDLERAVREGGFRADLFYRLDVCTLRVTPLRERRADLTRLVEALLPEVAVELGLACPALASGFVDVLAQHDWPGNVRELRNTLERVLVHHGGGRLEAVHARSALHAGVRSEEQPGDRDATTEIVRVLRETGGNVSRAARRLGVSRSTLRYRIQRHALQSWIPRD